MLIRPTGLRFLFGWLHAVGCSQGCDLALSGIQPWVGVFIMCRDGDFSGGRSVAPVAFTQTVKKRTAERENEPAAGLQIGNDLWVTGTSWDAVNRPLTFLLANLHLSELKCSRRETKGKHLLNEVRDKEDSLDAPVTDFSSFLAACQQQELLLREQMHLLCKISARY